MATCGSKQDFIRVPINEESLQRIAKILSYKMKDMFSLCPESISL